MACFNSSACSTNYGVENMSISPNIIMDEFRRYEIEEITVNINHLHYMDTLLAGLS
jgi:hypothetical protein